MQTNQRGEPIREETLYAYGTALAAGRDDHRDKAIALLCEHLGVEIIFTNATKHGTTEVVLRKVDAP